MKSVKLSVISIVISIIISTLISQACQSQPIIRGIRFEPDTISGTMWFNNYSWQRPEVLTELSDLKSKTNVSHILVLLTSAWQISYPTPKAQEITDLNQFLIDANASGFKVILHIATPCIISNPYADSVGEGPKHVGGHKTGEVVNGWTLYWDVPYCIEDGNATVKAWFSSIMNGIQSNISTVDLIDIGGHHRIPFGAESNLFFTESPTKVRAAQFHREITSTIKSIYPNMKVASSLVLSTWKTGPSVYDQAEYVKTEIPNVDYYDFLAANSISKVDVKTLTSIIPANRIILGDTAMTLTVGYSRYTTVAHWLSEAQVYQCAGWWIWEYRDRCCGGLRALNRNGGLWNEPIVTLVRSAMCDPNSTIECQ